MLTPGPMLYSDLERLVLLLLLPLPPPLTPGDSGDKLEQSLHKQFLGQRAAELYKQPHSVF